MELSVILFDMKYKLMAKFPYFVLSVFFQS